MKTLKKSIPFFFVLGLAVMGCSKSRDTSTSSSLSNAELGIVLNQASQAMASTSTNLLATMNYQPAGMIGSLGNPALLSTTTSSQVIGVTTACASGGTFVLAGNSETITDIASSPITFQATMTVTQTFTDCAVTTSEGTATLGGAITLTNATADMDIVTSPLHITGTFTVPISGTVTYKDATTDASCDISGTSTQTMDQTDEGSTGTVTWSGSVCGTSSEASVSLVNGVPQT